MRLFFFLLEAVLQLTLKLSGLPSLKTSVCEEYWTQDSEIDALEHIVYQHHWIDQEVVLGMIFYNAFYFNFDVIFPLPPVGSGCHKKL